MPTTQSTSTLSQDSPSARVFPRPDTVLAQVIGDPAYRKSFHQRLQSSNRFVVALYRVGLLPLLGAGKTTMLLITRGRKTNRLRRFPVGYFRIGGHIHLLSGWGRASNWYKNLRANPAAVWLQIGFRTLPVQAHIIEDPAEVRRTLECLIIESPDSAQRLFGWDPKSDRLDRADFSLIIEKVLIVKFMNR
ncbi:MAG TPA: nitroreductase/quinone reductase family protein [Anaerolineales bacterium]|nr:nitroreductase/quinone reductase family protein [Anaerolineales bacterium]